MSFGQRLGRLGVFGWTYGGERGGNEVSSHRQERRATMTPSSPSKLRTSAGFALFAVGVAVFVVRFLHAGPYAMLSGTSLLSALGALLLSAPLV